MTDGRIDLGNHVRDIPDFPKEGILFRDIMPLLQDPVALREAVDRIIEYGTGKHIDVVLGAEARGFILGAAVAYGLGAGFVCARKPGKLPYTTISAEYALEYGTDKLEIHEDAIKPGQNVLVHDDLLATGGTAKAKIELVEKLGGKVVGCAFLIELTALEGRAKLEGYDIVQPDQLLTPAAGGHALGTFAAPNFTKPPRASDPRGSAAVRAGRGGSIIRRAHASRGPHPNASPVTRAPSEVRHRARRQPPTSEPDCVPRTEARAGAVRAAGNALGPVWQSGDDDREQREDAVSRGSMNPGTPR